MLRSLKDLEQYAIGATDGEIGHVKDFYFDDDAWTVRYLVVDAGSWWLGKQVLISPLSIELPNWAVKTLTVSISRDQVKRSPSVDIHRPVSRQHEMDYMDYYGYPYYWGGGSIWANGLYPYAMVPGFSGYGDGGARRQQELAAYDKAENARHRSDDPHLRSCKAVVGYYIYAADGEIGHVDTLLVDEDTWAIRYLVVNTGHWWADHKVVVATQWITGVSWEDGSVSVNLERDVIMKSPLFHSSAELNRQQERKLYEHYGRQRYWLDE